MNHSGALRRKSGITVHDFLSERKAEEHGDPPAETREDNPPEAEQAVPPTKIARSARKAPKKKTACEISSPSPAAVPAPAPTIERSPSKILMDEIGTFLTGNDLDITPANLARAHAICSGEQPEFAALTAAMKDRGEPITQQWLDTLAYDDGRNEQDRAEVDRMASNLQNSIEAFATNARDACTAVADYREAMNSHAQEAEEIDSQETAEELLGRVTELTRAIREQAQLAEEKMQRSEREAISLRRDLEEAQRVANIDHLTGLPNRRALDEMLERLWSDARDVDWDGSDEKEREPVAIAFCDIDNFKPVNDIHGHDTGDRVLQMVARTLAEGAGEDCQVVRYGGEEFVVVYRGFSLEGARENLDAIRTKLSNRPFINRTTRQSLGMITFSGGIADLFAFPDRRSALRAADEALYRAKNSGRDRIELATPPVD